MSHFGLDELVRSLSSTLNVDDGSAERILNALGFQQMANAVHAYNALVANPTAARLAGSSPGMTIKSIPLSALRVAVKANRPNNLANKDLPA